MPARSNVSEPGRHAARVHEVSARRRTKTGSVSTMSFSTRPGTATISLTRRTPRGVEAEVHDEVDRARDRGHDEPRRDVLARQQRQGAELHQRLARAVGVQRRHAGQAGVEGQQQVEALGRPDLADDDPGRPHPQRLADQVAQRHLAGALEPDLPRLHRDPVGMREAELEDLLGRDDPVAAGDRRGQAVQHRGLARLRAAGDDDVLPGEHGGLEEARGAGRQRAEADEVVEPRGLERRTCGC